MLAALLMVIGCLTACDRVSKETPSNNQTTIEESVDQYFNPTFDDVDALIMYRDILAKDYVADSVFRCMPETALKNAATVCINRYGNATPRGVVDEYQANMDVYSNLKPPLSNSTQNEEPSICEKPSIKNEATQTTRAVSHEYYDTIIDGKKAMIKLTKEVEYEK